MKRLLLLSISLLFLSACIEAPRSIRDAVTDTDSVDGGNNGGGGNTGGDNAIPGSGTENLSIPEGTAVEITQIIDPNTGTFKKKVSIPKDFKGKLHLSGLNISSLKDKVVMGRFYFGKDRTPVELEGVIGQVPGGEGLTQFASINVITFDMGAKPFFDIRLLYDLFDYNDYDSDTESDVITDPTNAGLYCRGLRIEDDPTFTQTAAHPECNQAGDTCLYAYAKVGDQTLWREDNVDGTLTELTDVPKYEHIDIDGNLLSGESLSNNLLKCLPNKADDAVFKSLFGSSNAHPTAIGSTLTLDSKTYTYRGPYRVYDADDWEISGAAVYQSGVNPKGVFKAPFAGAADFTLNKDGQQSYLFPRAAKINYQTTGVQYLGSTDPFGLKGILNLSAAGDTEYMEGCNLRAKMRNDSTNETVSSCNVTGTIELYTMENGFEVPLTSTKDVKLQILMSGLGTEEGYDYNALKNCSANSQCGSGECCFNNKCFSRGVVGQCADDFEPIGNQPTGNSCDSDFDCASLCCNGSTRTCNDHINNDFQQVLCSKVPNQSCVSREFCRIEYVRKCYLVKTTDPNDALGCNKRCFSVPTFGDCVNGSCRPPVTPQEPSIPTTPVDCQDPSVLQSAPFDVTEL